MSDWVAGGGGILSGVANIGGMIGNLIGRKKRQRHLERREDSAITRQARDMERAGLSKTLAAGGGAQSGDVGNVDMGMPDLGESVQLASDLMKQKQDISSSKAQEKLVKAQEERQHQELKNMSMDLDQKRLDYQRTWAEEQRKNQVFQHDMTYARQHGEPYGNNSNSFMKDIADNLREFPNAWGAVKDVYNGILPNLGEAARTQVKEALNGVWDSTTPWKTPREKAEVVRQKTEAMQADPRQRNPFGGP